VKATIAAGLASGPRDCKIAMLAYGPDIRGYLLIRQGKLRELGFGVSDLGIVKIDGVEEMVFSQSASPVGNAIDVSVVANGTGGLRVAVQWVEDGGMVDGELGREVGTCVRGGDENDLTFFTRYRSSDSDNVFDCNHSMSLAF
jgi:hypothetical protein